MAWCSVADAGRTPLLGPKTPDTPMKRTRSVDEPPREVRDKLGVSPKDESPENSFKQIPSPGKDFLGFRLSPQTAKDFEVPQGYPTLLDALTEESPNLAWRPFDEARNDNIDYFRMEEVRTKQALEKEDALLIEYSRLGTAVLPTCNSDVHKAFKALVRTGVPSWLRSVAWKLVTDAGLMLLDYPDLYSDASARVFKDGLPAVIEPPFPTFSFPLESIGAGFFLSPEGEQSLRRLLTVLHAENPDIEYCPSLTALVCLLLHFLPESDAYICATCMLEKSRKCRYYLNLGKDEVMLYVETFKDLIKLRAKRVWQYLEEHEIDAAEFAERWFTNFFFDCLPFQTALRVVDCWMVEGSKILYRVGLGILLHLERQLLTCPTADVFLVQLRYLCANLHNSDALLQISFDISLSRKHLRKLDHQNAAFLSQVDLSFYAPTSLYFHPRVDVAPKSVEYSEFCAIWSWMPSRYRLKDACLIYNTATDGYSFRSMLDACRDHAPVFVIISTTCKNVFGAFLSCPLRQEARFFGTAETFVFTVKPELRKYPWHPGNNNYFIRVDEGCLFVGASDDGGSSLCLAEDLKGVSQKCETFSSPPLVAGQRFTCRGLEVFSLSDG